MAKKEHKTYSKGHVYTKEKSHTMSASGKLLETILANENVQVA